MHLFIYISDGAFKYIYVNLEWSFNVLISAA